MPSTTHLYCVWSIDFNQFGQMTKQNDRRWDEVLGMRGANTHRTFFKTKKKIKNDLSGIYRVQRKWFGNECFYLHSNDEYKMYAYMHVCTQWIVNVNLIFACIFSAVSYLQGKKTNSSLLIYFVVMHVIAKASSNRLSNKLNRLDLNHDCVANLFHTFQLNQKRMKIWTEMPKKAFHIFFYLPLLISRFFFFSLHCTPFQFWVRPCILLVHIHNPSR